MKNSLFLLICLLGNLGQIVVSFSLLPPPERPHHGSHSHTHRSSPHHESRLRNVFYLPAKKTKSEEVPDEARNITSASPPPLDIAPIIEPMLDPLFDRIKQLEALTSKQQVEIRKLKRDNDEMYATISNFDELIEILRASGLGSNSKSGRNPGRGGNGEEDEEDDMIETEYMELSDLPSGENKSMLYEYEYFDDSEIFGVAPSSVIEAADSAGAAILAAMLGGQRRMLVDVRDAELTNNPEILAQFLELSILPVAAGLEGLNSERNRVKIVFPTVAQLLEYRKLSALAAPDVVALGTLNFGSLEDPDALIILVAPSPEDKEEFQMMLDILSPKNPEDTIEQPVVLLNYHMSGMKNMPEPVRSWEVIYHLRLLSVQYLAMAEGAEEGKEMTESEIEDMFLEASSEREEALPETPGSTSAVNSLDEESDFEDLASDAAFVDFAEEQENSGVVPGTTRAMVIRSYPRPWHVFVDTSPDEDADFEVAATFEVQPNQDEVNLAIVNCLQGSQEEDELVAKEMKEALEAGQLDNVTDRLNQGLAAESEGDGDGDGEEDGDLFPVPLGVEYDGSQDHPVAELFVSGDDDDSDDDVEDEDEDEEVEKEGID
ncbi:hypothetical protein TrST_g8810 [Triparma strigata]|uniref:DUF1995 domain-containing protein n=2 Tax=Triparma strigata TaxID=1606541 RepID=A0A9W7F1Z0_9STRA|nr:hypothetical protein TrST_g8810 [Triparma strigata]